MKKRWLQESRSPDVHCIPQTADCPQWEMLGPSQTFALKCVISIKLKAQHFLMEVGRDEMPASLPAGLDEQLCKCQSIPSQGQSVCYMVRKCSCSLY